MKNNKKLIYIPAKNVSSAIISTLKSIPQETLIEVTEILIVDDNSHDDTINQIEDFQKNHPNYPINLLKSATHLGYGGNQKKAYQYALENGFDYVVMLHGDNQYPSQYIMTLFRLLEENKNFGMVFGSRMTGEPLKGGMPILRYIFNICLTKLENWLLRLNLSEFHSGFRAYSCNALRSIDFHLCSNNFLFDTDIIIKLHCKSYTFGETTIPTHYGPESSSISYLKSAQYIIGIFQSLILFQLAKKKVLKSAKFTEIV